MFKYSFILFFLCLNTHAICSSGNKVLLSLYKNVIETLADDNMQGRAVSSKYETEAADFIFGQFAGSKLGKPVIQEFEFLNPETKQQQLSKNVYCYVNNNASQTILIGAHYDHIGLGEIKSLSLSKKGQVHNGADDNASGVALMIGLMNQYQMWALKQYNYIFVAYSAHEIGLYGSKDFKDYIALKVKPLALVLNFDMVGRLDENEKIVAIYGYNSISARNSFFSQKIENLNIRTDENDMVYLTDASIFAKSNIPSLSFTTGTHDDYHKVTDDAKYINYKGIYTIQKAIEGFLKTISI